MSDELRMEVQEEEVQEEVISEKESSEESSQESDTPNEVSTEESTDEKPAKEAQEVVDKAGLDWNTLKGEWEANGEFSKESYEAFEKIGISKEMVDDYVNTKRTANQAVAEQLTNTLANDVGGKENLKQTIEWAANNISKEEKEAYNKAIDSQDPMIIRMFLKDFNRRMIEVNGQEPNLIEGKDGSGSEGVFRSREEFRKAYTEAGSNERERAKVLEKLRNSKAQGLF